METRVFKENESYKHKLAKELLAKWLTDIENTRGDACSFGDFAWRVNYGVFVELKFYETSDPCYFEMSGGLKSNKFLQKAWRKLPADDWFRKNFNRGKILFVPDVCIFHKGSPVILIEIVHTHTTPDWKIKAIKKFFGGQHVELYEVMAEDILCQISPSMNFPIKRII